MSPARVAAGLFFVLLAGCPSAFERDAATVDGGPDGGPDAPCPDRDGDGARDAACGGGDCDDGDGTLGPGRSRCTSPTTVLACAGPSRTEGPCELGVCDARTGSCSPDACGDGVVHPGESCDDGNEVDGDDCDADCRWSICVSDADCPAAAPSCSDYRVDEEVFRCRALQAGLAVSEPCAADAECASGFCDPEQLRCSHGCVEHGECGTGEVWCIWPEADIPFRNGLRGPHRCGYGCALDSECPAGRLCGVVEIASYEVMPTTRSPQFSFCRLPNAGGAPYGSTVPGALSGIACEGWTFAYSEMAGVSDQYCTRPCVDISDCLGDPVLRFCDQRLGTLHVPRPGGWRSAYATVCVPQPYTL